jgi:sirohydrochlorin cobaltochelatase
LKNDLSEVPAAYFLIAHGSRDARAYQGLEATAEFVRQHLATSSSPSQSIPLVGTGVLEFGDRPLSIQIADFARAAAAKGVHQFFLLPLFLAAGNHVLQDLPEAITEAQSKLAGEAVFLTMCPALSAHPNLAQLVRNRMDDRVPCDRWILLAHGTRRPEGNQPIDALAAKLGFVPAYWAISPTLEEPIQTLHQLGAQRIGIVPYFLFPGRITDAIEAHVVELKSKFSTLDLQITQPLNPSPLLAQLLVDCCVAYPELSQ